MKRSERRESWLAPAVRAAVERDRETPETANHEKEEEGMRARVRAFSRWRYITSLSFCLFLFVGRRACASCLHDMTYGLQSVK